MAIRLEHDKANAATEHKDRYGRLLAYVWTVPERGEPVLVNAEVIRQGYGSAYTRYPFDAERMKQFLELQGQARKAKAGLWADDALRPASKTEPKGEPGDKPKAAFVGSRNSTVYHRASCRHAGRIGAGNLVEFESAEEALAAGRRPCKVCRPPAGEAKQGQVAPHR